MDQTTQPPSQSSLSPTVFYILLALASQDRHGYDIMKQATLDSVGRIKLGPGSLYGTIKQLIDSGAIVEADTRPDPTLDDQRRRYYRLTPAGRRLLGLELQRFDQSLTQARRLGIYPHLITEQP